MNREVLEKRGRIFDIQRFSIHDGPGIRTIVFLKGCPMRCRWCCNPESQEWEIQTMDMQGKSKVVGEDISVREVLDEVMKDSVYYRRSGGGITLSGGECLAQPEFSIALLEASKWYGLTTAIETAGYASKETVLSFVPYADTFLMDIKHMDSEKHKRYTSRENEKILDNARALSKSAKKLIIRVPVVPGFNDSLEEIRGIAEFAKSLESVEELHLLPYHNIGTDKYKALGREYQMSGIQPPEQSKMKELLYAVNDCGLRGQIGG